VLLAPFRIPGLITTTRTFLLQYGRSSNNSANIQSQQMPTLLQRAGDFSQTLDGFGNPVQMRAPRTELPFRGNVIPADRITAQAATLLGYYPLPQEGATSKLNYQ